MLADQQAGCQAGIPPSGQAVRVAVRLSRGFSMPRDRNAEALPARSHGGRERTAGRCRGSRRFSYRGRSVPFSASPRNSSCVGLGGPGRARIPDRRTRIRRNSLYFADRHGNPLRRPVRSSLHPPPALLPSRGFPAQPLVQAESYRELAGEPAIPPASMRSRKRGSSEVDIEFLGSCRGS